jgi:hypothetical protein
MIVGNKATEIGDIIVIKSAIPIVGVISLSTYSDSVVGETADRFFLRTFRYSLDGFTYSPWQDLTDSNLSAISIVPTDYFFVEYQYERGGTDISGDLEFVSVTLNGQFQSFSCGVTFSNSIFTQFLSCPDLDALLWCINVTEKLYKKGIVPSYLDRGQSGSTIDDKDYLDFWRTVACFFAMIVIYGRHFEQFKNYSDLLLDFLRQRNIFLCDNTSQEDMLYILSNYYDEIRQRGTIQICKEKTSSKVVDGELLRLICYITTDEFLFNVVKKEKLGWNVSNSSPMYRGVSDQLNVNKAWEFTEDVIDLDKYPLYNSQYIHREKDEVEDKWVLAIQDVPFGSRSGIGPNIVSLPLTDFTKAIKIDPGIDYEITFWIKQPTFDDSDSDSLSDSGSWIGSNSRLNFGVYTFDENNNWVYTDAIDGSGATPNFLSNVYFPNDDMYYFVRGIIFNSSEPYRSLIDSRLNISDGKNLRFRSTAKKMIPFVFMARQLSSINCVYVYDVKVRPVSTPWSTGFINANNFIEAWIKNNNKNHTTEQLEEIIRRYLIPYNSTFKNIYL